MPRELGVDAADFPTGQLTAQVLEGSIVRVTAPQTLNPLFSSFMELVFPSGTREIASGDLGYGRWVADELQIGSFDQEYEYQGGRLLVGGAVTTLFGSAKWMQRIAIWEGANHSLKTVQVGGDAEGLVALYEQLNIDETETGVTSIPKSIDLRILTEGLHGPQIATTIGDVGIVHVRRMTPELRSTLPDWSGIQVLGGELFLDDTERTSTFVIAGDSAYTKFYPASSADPSESLEFASSVVVSWDDAESSVYTA